MSPTPPPLAALTKAYTRPALAAAFSRAREKALLDELARVLGLDPARVSLETMRVICEELATGTFPGLAE